jgi:hypothetical protein
MGTEYLSYDKTDFMNIEEFIDWKYSLDIIDFDSLLERIDEGILSIASDPLGVFFELMRVSDIETIGQLVLHLSGDDLRQDDSGEYHIPMMDSIRSDGVLEKYGFDVGSPSSFFNGVNLPELCELVNSWHSARGEIKRWNPLYAPVDLIPVNTARLCRENHANKVLYTLDINRRSTGLIYPMTGWTLAECMRMCYESKPENDSG